MPAIVEFPRVVSDELERFADLFANEPQRRHCGEYLTGLIVARNKTVTGINAEFMSTTDPSCLNRFVTDAEWDVERLNARRLELLQEDPATHYATHGVIALDDVLVDHDGKLIEDVGWFWDHAEDRHKIAHDYLFANYVCPGGQHYPLEFRRFKKRDQCEATGEQFEDHGRLFRQLVDWVCEHEIPGDFAFDSYFSSVEDLNHIHGKFDGRGDPSGRVDRVDSPRRASGIASRRRQAVVLHRRRPPATGEASRADRPLVAQSSRSNRGQGPGDQSSYALGNQTHSARLPTTLDRHRNLSPRRQTEIGHGSLPAPQWPGPDKAHAPGDGGLQSPDATTPQPPRNEVGPATADDHRPSLPSCCRRDPPDHHPMGHHANH